MSDQVLTVRNVRPEVAGGDEGRCGDAQVDLHSAGLPQQDYDLAGGGAPDDGVVDHHHPPPLHTAAQRPQLNAHRLLPAALIRGNESAADIAVFDQTHSIGESSTPPHNPWLRPDRNLGCR